MATELYNMANVAEGITRFDSSEFTLVPGRTSWDGHEIYPCVLTDGKSDIAFTDDAYAKLYEARRKVIVARCTADYGKA